MQGKRVFVSGGAGVIGLDLIPHLIGCSASIFVGDLKPRPKIFPPEVRYRQGDLNSLTKQDIESFAPEIFIHLAATFERSTETYSFWAENYWHNIRLSHHLMTILKELPSLKRVVFASSYLIYDPNLYQFQLPQTNPISLKESDRVLPRNLTGMAKLAHEIELQFFNQFQSTSFTSVCARIFRGYGKNSRDIISRWIRDLLADKPIKVYRPEGLFDYIYAADSAEGLVRLANNKTITGIINLGTGRSRRVSDIINILRVYFPSMEVIEESSDIPFEASQADMTAYYAGIGWKPKLQLEETIPTIIAYEKEKLIQIKNIPEKIGKHILVTSASKKVSLVQAVQKASQKLDSDIKVIAGDLDKTSLTSFVADDFWEMPPTIETQIDALIAGCKDRNIHTIIPTRDGELLFWSQYQTQFAKAGISVIVSPFSSVQVCLDKLAFAQLRVTHNLPFILTADHPDKINAQSYVVKERYGAGSRKIGLNLNKEQALAHGKQLENPIYQPFIVGKEISVDAWLSSTHQLKGLVLRSRDNVINGEAQVTTTFRDTQLEAEMVKVLQILKLSGPVVLQALIDENQKVHIIECNPRFGGASTASIAVGLDIFYWSLLESYDVDLTEYPFNRSSSEVRQVRIPSDIHVRV
ncbi:NAD-dependent epimerase/dehydratase family protein [Planktothricoides raciborskii]|uniref:ATP-grasp domain-containing protein n=1 Tax=Planktothricoides raciborskii FACHB-1370 TaxID=2949576 RepID=A0ABR8EFQ1_9CYAN|nr:NAD-dependent epimerase/dehydratase family protein [Planktothricoides raciborskii]MBD2544978.1 ATP-grasp domain-containing protein [Planktothricoides raciborskii FACHB-1370]MBD2584718.1 ATP-grasp domain-containing protein [Planktothricoides raciborskii FACHB-1261]